MITEDSRFDSTRKTSSPFTWNHTISTGRNKVLVIGLGLSNITTSSVPSISALTYNGVSLVKVREDSNAQASRAQYSSIWILHNPDVGTNIVSVTATNFDEAFATSSSYFGAKQASTADYANGNNGTTGGLKTFSIVPVANNCRTLCVAVLHGATATLTSDTANVNWYDHQANGSAFFTDVEEYTTTMTGGSSYTVGFTPSGITIHGWAMSGISIAPAIEGFTVQGQDIKDILLSDYELLDRYVGNKLWAWGRNAYGELGDNTRTPKSSPVQTVAGGTTWKQASGGAQDQPHSAAVKTDGTLWTWGYNSYGQLGDNTVIKKSSPVQTVAGGTIWKQVSCGGYFTAAIKTDGALWLWGRNLNGQLGDNTSAHKSSPVQTVAGGTSWQQVSAGSYSVAAIKTDGTLWTWGKNDTGQLGDNTTTQKSSPVQTVAGGTTWKQVNISKLHVVSIKTDGTLWLWGENNNGQLGDNTTTKKSSPVQTIAGGTTWKQVANGSNHTIAIKIDGTLWTWGYNAQGQLGNNTVTAKSSPAQTIVGGTNWKQVTCGKFHSTAIKTDGTLWGWGWNVYGQLGDNTSADKSSPVQTVAGGTTWKLVGYGFPTTLAVTYGDA